MENQFMQNRHIILTTILVGLGFLARPKSAQAVDPPPEGGYPGGNTAEGQNALLSLTSGTYNTAVGFLSIESNATGEFNTATGAGALLSNNGDPTAGEASENTAFGAAALLSNTTGVENTATGAFALFNSTTANFNTATGSAALLSNTTGGLNTATGSEALTSNTTGNSNTATGSDALHNNTAGHLNTAIGQAALVFNTAGSRNTAAGALALFNNTADENTAVGYHALQLNTDAAGNTAVGSFALENSTGRNNTADGFGALAGNTSGSNNVALGNDAGHDLTTGDNNIDIGNEVVGVAGEHDTIRIGNTNITDTFIRGISGTTVSSGATVFVAANGHLGTMTSSKRFKEDIKPMDKTSEALFALKPIIFRYKKELDPDGTHQFGLVAEDVEKVNPDLVVRDEHGKVNSVRYDQVNAMLLNEFLKAHRKMEEQQQQIDALTAQLKEQATEIQNVRAQVQFRKLAGRTAGRICRGGPMPQTVANDQ
jgi:hypothetical protein